METSSGSVTPAALNITEAAAYISVGKSFLAELVARDEIPSIKLKSRRLFRRAALDAWLAALETEQAA